MKFVFELEIKLSLDDWNAVKLFIQKRMQAEKRSDSFWNSVVRFGIFVAIMVVVLLFYGSFFDEPFNWPSAIIGFVFMLLVGIEMIMSEQKKLKYLDPLEDGFILGKKKLTVDENQIVVAAEHFQSHIDWAAILEIAESDEHIYLFVDKVDALVIPKRQLDDPAGVLKYFKACHQS